MKKLILFIGLSFGFFYTNPGQAQTDSLSNKPNIKINVNVQRDGNGNVIGYDSSYVETWSSDGRNVNADSLMQLFNKRFQDFGLSGSDIPGFSDNSFFNDSTMTVPFPDFFSVPDFPDMEKMNKEMMEEMKRMQNYFGMPSVPVSPQKNNQKVKKEKTSFQTTKI